MKTKKRSFSMIEILIALVILSVFASASIVTFQRTVEANKDKICQQNEAVLAAAIDVYAVENDALPDSLAKLEPRHIHLAYLKVRAEHKESKIIGFFKNLLGIKSAYAVTLPEKFYGYNKKVLKCPADTTSEATSYTINTADFSSLSDLRNTEYSNLALVYDSAAFHKSGPLLTDRYQIGITPSKTKGKQTKTNDGTITPDATIAIPYPKDIITRAGVVEVEDERNNCQGGTNQNKCCKATQREWIAMDKPCREQCKEEGYVPPKRDGTPQGDCVEN